MTTTTRPTTSQRAAAIRMIAAAFRVQGIAADDATRYVLAVLDTSSRTVNAWAADLVADVYKPTCTCAAVYLGHALHGEGCALAVDNAAL